MLRLVWIYLRLLLLTLPSLVYAQESKYALELKDTKLEAALQQLARLGNYELTYVPEVIPDVHIEERWYSSTAEEMIFDLLTRYDLEGTLEGRSILIYEMQDKDEKEITRLYYGRISDLQTGKHIVHAYVFTNTGEYTLTDNYGLFAVELVMGRDSAISVSNLGYHDVTLDIAYLPDGRVDVALIPAPNMIEPVVITNIDDLSSMSTPSEDLINTYYETNSKTINGSKDIIEHIAAQPGVIKVSEGRSGYSVHATATDQQLILIDDAPVFNPTHALGFLSLFSADAMSSASFYKEGHSARYGGRVGSILDIRLKEGSTRRWNGHIATNPYTSTVMIEGPILTERLSVLASGRLSHMNYLLDQVDPEPGFYIPDDIGFYDFIAKVNYTVSKNHRLFFSSFTNADRIRPVLPNQTDFLLYDTEWQNRTFTARWNAIWGQRLVSNTSLVYSDYFYKKSATSPVQGISYQERSAIDNRNARIELIYHLNQNQRIIGGLDLLIYRFAPASGAITLEERDFQLAYNLDQLRSNEFAAYLEDQIKISKRLNARLGLRLTSFSNIGNDAYEITYDDSGMVEDSTFYERGQVIRSHRHLQPRLHLDYQITPSLLLEASYHRGAQYIFRLLNENPSSPNEYWLPVGANIDPLTSHGYFIHLNIQLNQSSHLRVGGYYRDADGALAFRDGANLLFSSSLIDRQVTQGDFRSRGLDLSYEKKGADGYYRIAYAWTDATEQYDDISDGQAFEAGQAYTHDFNLQAGLDINERASVSANFQWRSGDLISLPSGYGFFQGFSFPVYRERNNFRLPSYQRLDLSMDWIVISREHFELELTAGVYNVLGRHNPYQISIQRDVNLPRLDVLSLTQAAPFINLKSTLR